MNFLKRARHYLDPRTHITAARSIASHATSNLHRVVEWHNRVFRGGLDFAKRESRKEYVQSNRYFAVAAKVVTPVLAAVASFIPVVGWFAGYLIAFAGAAIQRVSSGVEGRSKGIQGLENRQRARAAQNRTLKYGLYGAGIGNLVTGIIAIIGSLTATAATGAAVAGEAGAAGAGGAAATAGEAAAAEEVGNLAALEGASAGGETTLSVAPAVANTGAPQIIDTTAGVIQSSKDIGLASMSTATPAEAAAEGVKGALVQPGLAASSGAASSGILGTGVTWKDIGSVLSTALPFAKKFLDRAAAPGNALPSDAGLGTGGGGGEGSAPGGGLLDELSGLPLPVKIAAGVLGVGAVAYGLSKTKKRAA